MRCEICGEQIPGGLFIRAWNTPHARSDHPDYVEWRKDWFRVSLALFMPLLGAYLFILLYWLADLLPRQEVGGRFVFQATVISPIVYAFLVTIFYGVPVLFFSDIWLNKWRREFRDAWRKEHPS